MQRPPNKGMNLTRSAPATGTAALAGYPQCWADLEELERMDANAVFRHTWILFIAVTCANAAIWWNRGKKEIARQPELEAGYRSMIRGWLIYGNLPWVVMGTGIVLGDVPSVSHYFDPRNGPFVVAFYVTVVGLWILTAYWVFFKGGAEALIRHPGLLNLPSQSPAAVKAMVVLTLASGFAALTMMLLGYARVPE
jgi:hypothetical protein